MSTSILYEEEWLEVRTSRRIQLHPNQDPSGYVIWMRFREPCVHDIMPLLLHLDVVAGENTLPLPNAPGPDLC
jgi:hypothetical protein